MSSDPWERRLVLVFAAYLEEVEEVGAAGVDLDGILIGSGFYVGYVCDFEI